MANQPIWSAGDNRKYAGKPARQGAPKVGSYSAGPAETAANTVQAIPGSKSPSTYGNAHDLTSANPGPSGPFQSDSDNAHAKELLKPYTATGAKPDFLK